MLIKSMPFDSSTSLHIVDSSEAVILKEKDQKQGTAFSYPTDFICYSLILRSFLKIPDHHQKILHL